MGNTHINRWLLLFVAWFVAFNVRTVYVSVSPLLPLIQEDLALTYTESGLLFSMPLVLMGLCALPVGWMVENWGTKRVVVLAISFLFIGSLFRVFADSYSFLFLFNCFIGIGIGFAQPGLVYLVKDWFPERTGTATGIYSNGYMLGSTVAALLSGTLLLSWVGDYSWRGSLLVWAVFSGISLLLWVVTVPKRKPLAKQASFKQLLNLFGSGLTILKKRVVFLVIILFMLQSSLFYLHLNWLPAYYHSHVGWDIERASLPLSLFSFIMIPTSLIVPYLSDRLERRKPFLILSTAISLPIGLIGLLVNPGDYYWLWSILLGTPLCVFFVLGLVLPIDVGQGQQVGLISGWMLLIGHLGSILGPMVAGFLLDLTNYLPAVIWWGMVLNVIMIVSTFLLPETYKYHASSR